MPQMQVSLFFLVTTGLISGLGFGDAQKSLKITLNPNKKTAFRTCFMRQIVCYLCPHES
jgi:hypothetical protein